jgi:hypothetical protein
LNIHLGNRSGQQRRRPPALHADRKGPPRAAGYGMVEVVGANPAGGALSRRRGAFRYVASKCIFDSQIFGVP